MHALIASALAQAPVPPVSIRDMVELTDLSSVSISPDNRSIVYRSETASVERNGYELAWYVVPPDGSAPPRRIAGAGEGGWPDGTLFAAPPLWSADSRWIIYRAVIDGEAQLWRAARDGSRVEQMTHDPGNVTGFTLSADGGAVIYTTGAPREAVARAEQAEYDGGTLIDARVDPSRQLYRGARIDGRAATGRLHGFWFAHGGLLADMPPVHHVVDLATLSVREASGAEKDRLTAPRRPFDRADSGIVITDSDAHDARGIVRVLADGLRRRLTVLRDPDRPDSAISCGKPQCVDLQIVGAVWQQGADRVVFTTTDTAVSHSLHVWTVSTGAVRTIIRGKGLLNGGRDATQGCAAGQRVIACVAASANVPPRLIRIDMETGRTRTLADPNRALVRSGQPLFRLLQWNDGKGRSFTGQLMMPASASRPVPLFVTYYVCDGYLRGGTGDEFPLRQLASRGVAALCINRVPTAAGGGDQIEQYRIAQSGVESAVDLLARDGLVDRRQIGMGGLSFGGEVTAWIATHSGLLAAASISSSLLTPTYYWFNAMKGREVPDMLRQVWGLGDPDDDAARWRELSPALNATAFTAPLLMQLPEQEYRLNVELAARLGRSTTPVELWAFPGETHVKYQPRHKLAVYERNLDWFRYWLQGHVDPDPLKAGQYRRWRAFARIPGWHDAASGGQSGSPSQPLSQRSMSATGSSR